MSSTPATSGGKPDAPASVPTGMEAPGTKETSPTVGGLRSCWTWWALFCVVAGILYLRQPGAIRHASFIAEDGAVFFKQQYENGFAASLFTRSAGYLHFVPRTVAGLCSLFVPLEFIPAAYAVISLLIASAILTFFYSNGFRRVIESDLLRAIVVLCLPFMPNNDSDMRVAYLCWYLLFFLVLLTVYYLPKKAVWRWLLFVPAALAVWSAPLAVVCLPLVLLRAWQVSERGERTWWLALAVVMVAFPFTADHVPSYVLNALREPKWFQALLHAEGLRVFCSFFLGEAVAQQLPPAGWRAVLRLSTVLLVPCVWVTFLALKRPRLREWSSWAPAILFYYVLACPALFVLRTEWVPDYVTWSERSGHERYFLNSVLVLCVLGGVVFERLSRDRKQTLLWTRSVAVVLLLCWLRLHLLWFRLWDWRSEQSWKHFAGEIRAAESRAMQSGSAETVRVETGVKEWNFDLSITPESAARNHVDHHEG